MHNSDKSNKIYSQYIAKELLDSLAVFLESTDKDEIVKNAMVIAQEFGGSKDIAILISGSEDEKSEAESKLLMHFHNNLKLLVQKTWVEKSDETIKEQLLVKLDTICNELLEKKYSQSYSLVLQVLNDAVLLMFGAVAKSDDFAEYALRIDPGFGTFWWFLHSLPKEQNWSTEKVKIALVLGMYFLANY